MMSPHPSASIGNAEVKLFRPVAENVWPPLWDVLRWLIVDCSICQIAKQNENSKVSLILQHSWPQPLDKMFDRWPCNRWPREPRQFLAQDGASVISLPVPTNDSFNCGAQLGARLMGWPGASYMGDCNKKTATPDAHLLQHFCQNGCWHLGPRSTKRRMSQGFQVSIAFGKFTA